MIAEDNFVNQKVKFALETGLRPILCCGETETERDQGVTENIVRKHITQGLQGVTAEQASKMVIAYEPVWAIGTGRTAKSEDAEAVHSFIRNLLTELYSAELAEGIRIGEKAGIEPKYLLELLNDTGAKSFQMDVRGPWIASGDFNSRFGLELALKDVRLGVEMAQAWGNDAKTMQVTLDYLKQASGGGLGKEDCNAIYKIIK